MQIQVLFVLNATPLKCNSSRSPFLPIQCMTSSTIKPSGHPNTMSWCNDIFTRCTSFRRLTSFT